MIPCFLCGRDASTGWIKGFTPAPDSQKMALCAEHDNEKNRTAVARAWQERLRKDIAEQTVVAGSRSNAVLKRATVRFLAGGMLSFLCTACDATPQGTLRIVSPEGEQTFIPMQHVREYSLCAQGPDDALSGSPGAALPEAHRQLESEENKQALLQALAQAGQSQSEG